MPNFCNSLRTSGGTMIGVGGGVKVVCFFLSSIWTAYAFLKQTILSMIWIAGLNKCIKKLFKKEHAQLAR